MKKVLSLLLVAAMLVCMMPAMAFADEVKTGEILYATDKFGVMLESGATKAQVVVDEDYQITATVDGTSVERSDVSAVIEMQNVAGLGVEGLRSHEFALTETGLGTGAVDLTRWFPALWGGTLPLDGAETYTAFEGCDVNVDVNGKTFAYDINKVENTTHTLEFVGETETAAAQAAWAELTSHVTATTGAENSQVIIPAGAYLQIGTEKLVFDAPCTVDPSAEGGIAAAVVGIKEAATLGTAADVDFELFVPANGQVQLGSSIATVNEAMTLTVEGELFDGNELSTLRTLINSEEAQIADLYVLALVEINDFIAGLNNADVNITIAFEEEVGETGQVLGANDKFGIMLESGETEAKVVVDKDYKITATVDGTSVERSDVSAVIEMQNVSGLGVAGLRSHEFALTETGLGTGAVDLTRWFPALWGGTLPLDGAETYTAFEGCDVNVDVNGKTFAYNINKVADVNYDLKFEGTTETAAAQAAWAELTSNITATTGAENSQVIIPAGAYLQIGTEKLVFDAPCTVDPSAEGGIAAAVVGIKEAATLGTAAEVEFEMLVPAGGRVQLGASVAEVKEDMTLTVTGADLFEGTELSTLRTLINSEEAQIADLYVLALVEINDFIAGLNNADVNVAITFGADEGDQGGSDIFFPVYVAPVDPLAEERAEANAAVDLVEAADAAEYTEVADEIKAIADKAAADIAAAKTAEEIAAIEAEAKAAIEEIKLVYDVEETGLVARSKFTKSPKGKDAILITWYDKEDRDVEFEGVEIFRSTKRNSGFKKIFTSKTDKYYNTAIEEGVKYFYRVRGYVTVDGEKVYTDLSLRAIRTAK